MAAQDFITGPFGSAVPTVTPELPMGSAATAVPEVKSVPFTDEALAATDQGVAASRGTRDARAAEEDSNAWVGAGAGIMAWDTTRMLNRFTRPDFDGEAKIKHFEYLENIPEQLDEDEHEYFMETARGTQSAAYAMQVIRDKREAMRIAGNHPVAGTLTMFLDPLWLVVPPAVKVGRLTGAAGRATSGVLAGAGSMAVTAAGEGPVSDEEIALSLAIGAAVGSVFYKPGKGMVNADPDLPSAKPILDLTQANADRTAMKYRMAGAGDVYGRAVVKLDEVPVKATDEVIQATDGTAGRAVGETVVDATPPQIKQSNLGRAVTVEQLPGKHTYRKFITGVADGADPVLAKAARQLMDAADPAVWDMPVRLSGNARVYVSHKGFAVLRNDSNPFTIVHEAVHVATIRPIQQFIEGKVESLGPQTRKGVEGLNKLFTQLRDEWQAETGLKAGKDVPEHVQYAFKDMHEFAAQAISSPKFQKWLSERPGTKGQSAWRDFVEYVADMLGIKAAGSKLDEVLDSLDNILRARDTQYKDRSGKITAFEPDSKVKMPFMHEFSNVFSEKAIDNAKKYARAADEAESSTGRLVMMKTQDFIELAYPRERTYRDLTDSMREVLAEEKRGPIRTAINQRGLDEMPTLTMSGGKIVGHDGRHRVDVLSENFFDEIPVILKGKNIPAPGTRVLSETGDSTVELPKTVVRDEYVPAQMAPEELRPGAVNHDQAAVVDAVDTALARDSARRGLGEKLQWNMRKTMSNFGDAGKRIANILYDNNSDLTHTSVEAHREAILSDLRRTQFEYEDLMRGQMATEGFGTLKMMNPFTSRAAYAKQAEIERAVHREMFRREQAARTGVIPDSSATPKHITAMADKLDALHKKALAEMKASGVNGADNLLERAGYVNRQWNSAMIDDVITRFEKLGLDRATAHGKVVELVAVSLAKAGRMDSKLAKQIGGAIVDRAQRKGYFEDAVFNSPAGEGQLKELRDILTESGMVGADVERALNVLRVAQDEAGKAGHMKHRMDLDYDATVRVGNETVSIMDLIDSRVSSIVDQYIQRVSTQSALARKGLKSRSDIEKLRNDLLHDTPANKRDEARDLFDNTMAHFHGEPSGQRMNEKMRLFQVYGRSISLAWSGLWQMTEFATAMGQYGLSKTLKYAMQEIPGFKGMMRPDAETANSLNNVLAEHSMASLRLRPFIARYQDGFEMDTGSAMQLAGQTAGQIVPMANAMKYVHHFQAKVVGNLILDRVQMAAGGNAKARQALAEYGLEAPVMDKLAEQIKLHGLEVDKWDDTVWAATRPAFAKMMDSAVLKGRLGDMPAFAQFDNVGKFIFTYRTFVLTAHNKVMAGTLERRGAGAVGLILMYQLPLAMAAVQAQSVIKDGTTLPDGDVTKAALGQMGGLGLFSEPMKWVTGASNNIGAPALIPLDRGIALLQSGVNLDPNKGASTALTMLPVISAVPFMRGLSEHIKE